MCDQATMSTTVELRLQARSFPGRRDQIGAARAFLASFLGGHPAAEDAILLVSELAANAVAYSASGWPGGTFTVRTQLTRDDRVHVEVEDQGSAWNGALTAKPPHGLFLLRALAAACGTRRTPRGWSTWFILA